MAQSQEDIEKLFESITVEECYARIYGWHQSHGRGRIKQKYGREDEYSREYLRLLALLPSPVQATQHDMDFVFGEVISMLMEWAYHEKDEHGIEMAAYAHVALNKRYRHGFGDEEFRKSRQASALFVAPVSNLLLVVSEGRFRAIPTSQLDSQELKTPAGILLPTAPYVIIRRISLLWRQQLEEFEELLNDSKSSEAQYQEFFETYPQLLMGTEYRMVLPRPILEREEQGSLIPDFFLQPLEKRFADIFDLKLPTERLIVGTKDRLRFSGAVQEAVAQVREYRDYFEDPRRRRNVEKKYGLTAYRPVVAVIIGRKPENLEEEKLKQIEESLPPYLRIINYDQLLARMRRIADLYSKA